MEESYVEIRHPGGSLRVPMEKLTSAKAEWEFGSRLVLGIQPSTAVIFDFHMGPGELRRFLLALSDALNFERAEIPVAFQSPKEKTPELTPGG